MNQNGPFGLANAKLRFGIPKVIFTEMVIVIILDHFGPVHLPAVLWQLLILLPLPAEVRDLLRLQDARCLCDQKSLANGDFICD